MGEEPGARLDDPERLVQPVAHRIIDEKGVGARKGCDVAVRPVHQIAVKEDHRAGFSGRRDDAMGVREVCEMILRSEEHTSELQSLMRISYAVLCLKKKKKKLRGRPLAAKH